MEVVFRAILYSILHDDGAFKDLPILLCNHIKATGIRYSSFVVGNFNKYLDNIQKNAICETEFELTAASEVLSLTLLCTCMRV